MKPFYESVSAIHALLNGASLLVGTPFRENSRLPGSGIDCWGAVNYLQERAGAMPRIDLPVYHLDWTPSKFDRFVIAALEGSPALSRWEALEFDRDQPQRTFRIGDILRIRWPGPPHSAVVLGGRNYIHARSDKGVVVETLNTRQEARLIERVYRAFEN